uniref:Uncharacterized protein n=1 Tax=Fundulus heteroclitus TaxID=8078 RepID=A0A3Q2NT02_FUNHE
MADQKLKEGVKMKLDKCSDQKVVGQDGSVVSLELKQTCITLTLNILACLNCAMENLKAF